MNSLASLMGKLEKDLSENTHCLAEKKNDSLGIGKELPLQGSGKKIEALPLEKS